jgi:molybdopterin-guanine dinucleotide biosynthesis protein A
MIFGLVLAGGRSRRFGADKALAELNGRSLLEAALGVLDGACASVAISALAGGAVAERGRALGCLVLPDPPGAPSGPLSGVLAGLLWARERGADLLATTPCDTPFLPADLVARLARALQARDGAAVARAPDGPHPLCGLWRTSLIAPIGAMLEAGRHPPVRAALDRLGGRMVAFGDAAAFINVNTRRDLALAARSPAARLGKP